MKGIVGNFKEFKDTLSERIRSPFVGSFFITWSVINWKLLALMFYEQKDITINERILCIEGYIASKNILDLFVFPVLITLALLIIYTILNAIGLAIKLGYDNWVSPLIQNILYNKNIIEKPKYERIKRQYTQLKQELDENKEKLFIAEKEVRTTLSSLERQNNNSIETTQLNDITAAFDQNLQWENDYKFSDGRSGSEVFKPDKRGFLLNDGKILKIENIRTTPNGKILIFNKIVDGKPNLNYLVRDGNNNFYGIEGVSTRVVYRLLNKYGIIIYSAKYFCENNYIDVTYKIRNLIRDNIIEFTVTNELMGGDPGLGKPKMLKVEYSIGLTRSTITINENSILKFIE